MYLQSIILVYPLYFLVGTESVGLNSDHLFFCDLLFKKSNFEQSDLNEYLKETFKIENKLNLEINGPVCIYYKEILDFLAGINKDGDKDVMKFTKFEVSMLTNKLTEVDKNMDGLFNIDEVRNFTNDLILRGDQTIAEKICKDMELKFHVIREMTAAKILYNALMRMPNIEFDENNLIKFKNEQIFLKEK
ncbi:uncharacterized protein LOC126901863 [Daktulosphaira vitifoliae]|uniref:uncharacterized protein LOC126901863 n=1 Tax=Daktulosphaira vitifoliae TaxID=58002 RepID=UPI0021AA72E3|nr:uncharacterized protein LOC126901863 [Daktulosphaira vitifoliae]